MERFFKRTTYEMSSPVVENEKTKQSRVENNLDDLPSDPGLRKQISEYHPDMRDQVRRAYLLRGPWATFFVIVEHDGSLGDIQGLKESGSKKRVRSETSSATSSKACREKLRRDKLNDKFLELSYILEPGRPPKMDKAAILIDAVRMVNQLRGEAQKLKDSNSSLQEKIKKLKTEKTELRDEKQRLKSEKEKLEQQLKAMTAQLSFMPAPTAIPAAFAAQGQAHGNKMVPFIGYPGVAMWQFMPPAAVDTSQDHVLRPPVA